MKKYFIILDDIKQGPYTLEETISMNITQSSLVWYFGMDAWLEAKDVKEIYAELKKSPPPLPFKDTNILNIKAEIYKTPKKLLSRNDQINFAKEIKINFIILLCSLGIALIYCSFTRLIEYNFEISDAITKEENILPNGKRAWDILEIEKPNYLKTAKEISEVYFKYRPTLYPGIERDFLEPKKYYDVDEFMDSRRLFDRIETNLFQMSNELKGVNSFYAEGYYKKYLYSFLISFCIIVFCRYVYKFSNWVSITSKH